MFFLSFLFFIIYLCIVVFFCEVVWFCAFMVLKIHSYFQSDLYPFPLLPLNTNKRCCSLECLENCDKHNILSLKQDELSTRTLCVYCDNFQLLWVIEKGFTKLWIFCWGSIWSECFVCIYCINTKKMFFSTFSHRDTCTNNSHLCLLLL